MTPGRAIALLGVPTSWVDAVRSAPDLTKARQAWSHLLPDIKVLYKQAARKAHPDAGGSSQAFQELALAWDLAQQPGFPDSLWEESDRGREEARILIVEDLVLSMQKQAEALDRLRRDKVGVFGGGTQDSVFGGFLKKR